MHLDVLVNRMSAVATDSESIEYRNSHRCKKVSVRRASDLRFAEFKTEIRRDAPGFFKQFDDCGRSFERWPIDSARDEDFRSIIDGFKT